MKTGLFIKNTVEMLSKQWEYNNFSTEHDSSSARTFKGESGMFSFYGSKREKDVCYKCLPDVLVRNLDFHEIKRYRGRMLTN